MVTGWKRQRVQITLEPYSETVTYRLPAEAPYNPIGEEIERLFSGGAIWRGAIAEWWSCAVAATSLWGAGWLRVGTTRSSATTPRLRCWPPSATITNYGIAGRGRGRAAGGLDAGSFRPSSLLRVNHDPS